MQIRQNNNKKSNAELMANLTCELARTCTNKEHFFASKFNLTPAEFRCLRLFRESSTVPIKQIAIQMNLTPGRITHILTSLEAKKYIESLSMSKSDPAILVISWGSIIWLPDDKGRKSLTLIGNIE